jgi:hypothetical protein
MRTFVFLLICCVSLREDLASVLTAITDQFLPAANIILEEEPTPFDQESPASCEDELTAGDADLSDSALHDCGHHTPLGSAARAHAHQGHHVFAPVPGSLFALKKLII